MIRGGSRTAATSKMELFVIIFNGFQPLTIVTKCSILAVTAVLDLSLMIKWQDEAIKIYSLHSIMMSPCKTDGRNFELVGYSSLKRVS